MSLTFLRTKTTGNIDLTILSAIVRAKSDEVVVSISPSFIAFNAIFAPHVQTSVQYCGRPAVFISVMLLACAKISDQLEGIQRSWEIIYSGRTGKCLKNEINIS